VLYISEWIFVTQHERKEVHKCFENKFKILKNGRNNILLYKAELGCLNTCKKAYLNFAR